MIVEITITEDDGTVLHTLRGDAVSSRLRWTAAPGRELVDGKTGKTLRSWAYVPVSDGDTAKVTTYTAQGQYEIEL